MSQQLAPLTYKCQAVKCVFRAPVLPVRVVTFLCQLKPTMATNPRSYQSCFEKSCRCIARKSMPSQKKSVAIYLEVAKSKGEIMTLGAHDVGKRRMEAILLQLAMTRTLPG